MAESNGEQITSIKPDANSSESVESLKAQLDAAQKKISEQGKVLSEQETYVREADTLARLIQSNPNLQNQLKETYQRAYGVVQPGEESDKQKDQSSKKKDSAPEPNPQIENLTKDVENIKLSQKGKVLKDFEDKVGISTLPDEQKNKVRKEIESYVNTFGTSIRDIPADRLDVVLDKAHKAINVEKLVQEGKYEGMAELYSNQSGAVPHLQGRTLANERKNDLTPEQRSWAEKFGVPIDKVEAVYKERDNEQTRPTAAESKK